MTATELEAFVMAELAAGQGSNREAACIRLLMQRLSWQLLWKWLHRLLMQCEVNP